MRRACLLVSSYGEDNLVVRLTDLIVSSFKFMCDKLISEILM